MNVSFMLIALIAYILFMAASRCSQPRDSIARSLFKPYFTATTVLYRL
jgi:hypothetical protein